MDEKQVVAMKDMTKAWGPRVLGVVAGIGILAVGLPIIWHAFLGALGLAGLGILGLITVGTIAAVPYLGQRWENKILSMRIAEAKRRPIEQAWNTLQYNRKQTEKVGQGVIALASLIQGMKDMVADRKIKRPNFDATAQNRDIEKFESFLVAYRAKHQKMVMGLQKEQEYFEDMQFVAGFNEEGMKAKGLVNINSLESMEQQMLANVAYQQVRKENRELMASLEADSMMLTQADKLELTPGGLSLDVSSIRILEAERVQ